MVFYKETKGEPINHFIVHILNGKKVEVTTYYKNKTTLKKVYDDSSIKPHGDDFFYFTYSGEKNNYEQLISINDIENYRELRVEVRHVFGIDLPMPKKP